LSKRLFCRKDSFVERTLCLERIVDDTGPSCATIDAGELQQIRSLKSFQDDEYDAAANAVIRASTSPGAASDGGESECAEYGIGAEFVVSSESKLRQLELLELALLEQSQRLSLLRARVEEPLSPSRRTPASPARSAGGAASLAGLRSRMSGRRYSHDDDVRPPSPIEKFEAVEMEVDRSSWRNLVVERAAARDSRARIDSNRSRCADFWRSQKLETTRRVSPKRSGRRHFRASLPPGGEPPGKKAGARSSE